MHVAMGKVLLLTSTMALQDLAMMDSDALYNEQFPELEIQSV